MLMSCSRYLPVDETAIPLGELRPVAGSSFDLTAAVAEGNPLGALMKDKMLGVVEGGVAGIDHCYVVDGAVAADGSYANDQKLYHVTTVTEEGSGRQVVVSTTQPSVQIYTANFLSKDEKDFPHVQHNGMCMETQHFPDSINQPKFPSDLLKPGATYDHTAIYAFKTV